MDFKKVLFKTKEFDVEKALPDAVVFCNKEGKILWVNDKTAEMFETSKMHLLTSNIKDFIENAINLIENSISNSMPIISKLISKEVYFNMTSNEIDEGFVLDFRDCDPLAFDENKNNKKSNDEVNMNKNEFLLNLSNDLKSPLQSIVGFSQAMADGLGGQMTEQQDKYIKIIKKNASDLMYLIEKMLELSASECNNNNCEHKIFDLSNCINTIVKYNEHLYKGKEVKFNTEIAENITCRINSDETIFKNIFQGILEVILKSIEMGDINISISIPDEEILHNKNIIGNYLLVSISTTSLLLSENDLENLFEPYKILNSSNKKNIIRAITLASVKNFVEQLNGYIWVESKILKSTCFNVLLPLKSV